VTGTCPPDGVLEQLLTDRKTGAAEQALELHLASCAACRCRLEQINAAGMTLPGWPGQGPDIKAAAHLTPTPTSPGAATPPTDRPSTALTNPARGANRAKSESESTTDATVAPAADLLTTLARAEAAPSPPKGFGRYQVRRALGAGGFGTVYLGHDWQLDRPVAIKVLRASSGLTPTEDVQAFREARRLAQLRHPGIVAVHDVGVHEAQVYVVSDYLDGPDLGRWLNDHRPAWPEAVRIAAALADALAHAHARLIVHRDVKPANIILTADRVPVLVDFGLALDDAEVGGHEKGVISGTPCYMSPEQTAGAAHRIDGRTDIYSLGVVLYEMLTGRVPFRAIHLEELLRQVREDEPQPPRQLVRDIPPELEKVCLKAMAKRQQDRYTTAADFAEDLSRLLVLAAEAPASQVRPVESSGGETRAVQPVSFPPLAEITPVSRRRVRGPERRQVTVLVCGCDLFESEGYLEGLDAEGQARLLRAFQQVCDQSARRFGGTVVQCNDQGLLMCFGYPVAYEDGAARAARTGLALLECIKALDLNLPGQSKLEFNPWVGLHTGPAVVEATEDAFSLVGEARNVAVRLKEVAARDTLLCSDVTHRLIQRQFDCTSLGRRKIKGMVQPLELFQVQGISDVRSPIGAALRAGLTPLTGRDHEVSLLKDRWDQAREGMGQVVLLIGEAGLGKSRLVYTLKQHVQVQAGHAEPTLGCHPSAAIPPTPLDLPVVEWRCSPHFQHTSLYPACDFFERFLGFGREEVPASRFDRLVRHLDQYGLAKSDIVPLFAAILSLPLDDRFPSLGLSPVREREETFRALREWLRAYSERQPLLFILEDLHWLDASTLEFLGQFLAEGFHDRILTLLTFRPEFRTPWPALAHQTTLALNRLTRSQVGELVRSKTGRGVPEALVQQVFDRAGGVPLFVEEFTKTVQEFVGLDAPGGGESGTSALLVRAIPATLQDLVMARLDRMESEREVAQLAAVLGREFGYDLLATVAGKDEPTLQAELAKLAQAEILYPKGRPPRCSYIFKHALLEDALYNTLLKEKRQQFHRRIAETLNAQFPQTAESHPELVGHHFTEAGRSEEAIGYWLKAGQRSRERSAACEAIGHLTKGLSLLHTLPESSERDARELAFLTSLAPAYITERGYAAPDVGRILFRARELCQRSGDLQQLFGIMLGLWEWHLVRGDLRLCVDLASDGMALAERLNDPGILMEALFMPGATQFYRAQFAGARNCCENAVTAYDDRERTRFWMTFTGHNAGVTHRCYLALALWHLGYPDQALSLDRETRTLARTIGHQFSLGHAVDFSAFLNHYCRLGSEVQTAAEEEMTIGTEQGFQLWHALGTLHRGAGILLQGQPEEALPLLLKGLGLFRATGAAVRTPAYLALLGDAYTKCARYEDAHQALNDALAVAEKNDDRCHQAELYRLQGEVLLAESRDGASAAADCFLQAIETARSQQSRAWEMRATTSLARLWQQQGRQDEARAALAAVYGTYTEGFTTPDLVDARALLNT
jgi:class 3 adenylate cyclase/predicted ATPase